MPVLFNLFGAFGVDPSVGMQVAVGTSLATIIPTSISSARSHWRKGAVDRELLTRLAPTVFLGVIAGTFLASIVSGRVLTAIFASVAALVAINLALGRSALVLGDKLPGQFGLSSIGAFIGTVSAMMGIGGGTLTVPILSLFRYPRGGRHGCGTRPDHRDPRQDRICHRGSPPRQSTAVRDRLRHGSVFF